LEPFRAQTPKFYLKRHFWNYVARTTWYSRRWSYIVYESRLTGLLHRIMYSFREKPKDFRQNW
jgi:predicted hydrolase (HD superfamily)